MLEIALMTGGGGDDNNLYVAESGPGTKWLIKGDLKLGYFGEVSSSELLKASELADQLELFNMGIPAIEHITWLKFAYNYRFLFIAKKPIRHTVSWESIYVNGLVYGTDDTGLQKVAYTQVNQARTVHKDGHLLRVRLLKGASDDVSKLGGREWNDLIYRVYSGDPSGSNWANFTDEDLGTNNAPGSNSWVQERYETTNIEPSFILRGGYSSSGIHNATRLRNLNHLIVSGYNGWRPCLELVMANDPLLKPLPDVYRYEGLYPNAPGGLSHYFSGYGDELLEHGYLTYTPVGLRDPGAIEHSVEFQPHSDLRYTTVGLHPVGSIDDVEDFKSPHQLEYTATGVYPVSGIDYLISEN